MAFDGITTANLVSDLKNTITGGCISRIIQPEKDELLLTVRVRREQYLLSMSANASLPLLYLTDRKKEAPMTAPNFCMLLRKHMQGGVILDITQPSLERIVILTIQHHNEMGDTVRRKLIIELMGKYSNIIFTDENDTIIDSIKRVPESVSSVREVLPGRKWFIPAQEGRSDPFAVSEKGEFRAVMEKTRQDLVRGICGSFTGFSKTAAEELCFEAGADPRKGWGDLDEDGRKALGQAFENLIAALRGERFEPSCVMLNGEAVEFASLPLTMYAHAPYEIIRCPDAGTMIRTYYGTREKVTRMRQKSADLRHIASSARDRVRKKLLIQEKQMQSTEKRETYRIYGELLNAFGYSAEEGAREFTCTSYYDGQPVTIPLDPLLTTSENAQHYFARYNKLKRTAEAMETQIAESRADSEQLDSILVAIDLAETESDLAEIRRELEAYGFAAKKAKTVKGARREAKSEPYSYTSSDGFEILVGRNNYQNEELSFKTAEGGDWWFHAKGAPGSHVIVRCRGKKLPDRTFEEAASLAAWYSSLRKAPKAEVDYTQRKNLRKKNGGKPGFVIYHTNYSMMVTPGADGLQRNR